MREKNLFRVLAGSLLFGWAGLSLGAESTLYYILDGSGSMWGRIGGEPKIVIAKEVMSGLIQDHPERVDSGLTVYGHRRKGDCSDIEHLIPVGPLDRASAIKRVEGIQPKGKTPIAASINQAVEAVKGREGAATIVLVSDGLETCGQDPCGLTEKLKATGVAFTLHSVGFDVSEQETNQLTCIATAGGGRYFPASSAEALREALTTVQEAVVENKVLTPPEPVETVSDQSTSIRIKAKGPGTIRLLPEDWVKKPEYWKLLDPETGETRVTFKRPGLDNQRMVAGEYQLAWKQSQHTSGELVLGEVIRVESGEVAEVPLKTGIRLNLPEWVKRPKWWGLSPKGENKSKPAIWFRDIWEQLVPPGDYQLLWRQAEHGAMTVNHGTIEIEADKLNQVDLKTAIKLVKADWVPKKVKSWRLYSEGGDLVAWYRQFLPQLVPPGKYTLIYRQSEHRSTDSNLGEITVKAGVLNEFALNTGVKFIPPEGGKKPEKIDFIRLSREGKEIETVSLKGSFGPMLLQPGRYRIDLQQKRRGSTFTIVDSFELPTGAVVEIEL